LKFKILKRLELLNDYVLVTVRGHLFIKRKAFSGGRKAFQKIPIAREADKNGALSFYILFAAR
jgi:hypothetical protein